MNKQAFPPSQLDLTHFEDEHEVVAYFFSFFPVKNAKERLQQFYLGFRDSEISWGLNKQQDNKYLFFYQQLCILIEASYILHRQYLQELKRQYEADFEERMARRKEESSLDSSSG